LQLKAALRKYRRQGGNLAGIEAMRLAESEPLKAAALIETVARRKAVNLRITRVFRRLCLARMRRAKEAVDWLREAAGPGSPATRCLRATRTWIDPSGSDLPGIHGGLAETVDAFCERRCSRS